MKAIANNAMCVYDFTVSKAEGSLEVLESFRLSLVKTLRKYCKKWTFQEEVGSSGYRHYQGRVSFKVKTRKPNIGLTAHWSLTSDENRENMFYVTKEDSRVGGPWADTDMYIPRQIREIAKLYPWQQKIVDDRLIWDTRHINIIVDIKGNIGKSILKTWIGVKGLGRALAFQNDYRDLMRMVMDTDKKSLYIVDIPRALKKDHLFQFFSAIETLKDGYAFDDRYNFREAYFDSPNIWVFTNVWPDEGLLSPDRWKFWRISHQRTLNQV